MSCLVVVSDAAADFTNDLFRVSYEIGALSSLRRGTNSLIQFDSLFDGQALDDITDGAYDPTQRVVADVDLRGVDARVGFEPNSTEFFFRVPAAGIDISFDGGDRDASVEAFEEWLQGQVDTPTSPRQAVTRLLQAFVADSSVDPIAGNPYSLQTRMLQAPYDLGMRSSFRPADPTAPDGEGRRWRGEDVFDMRADFAPFRSGRWSGFVTGLAFEYTVNFEDPRFALVFDLPISYTQTESDAHTATAHGGVGFLYRVTPWWNLLAEGRAGISGSIQLGGLAVIGSGGATSHMQWQLGDAVLRLGNGVTVASSVDGIEWAGYELTYDITNVLVRNGIEVEQALPARLCGHPLFARLSITDSWVVGSDVFVVHYGEVGVHVGTTRSLGSGAVRDRTALGFVYTGAGGYNGIRVLLTRSF